MESVSSSTVADVDLTLSLGLGSYYQSDNPQDRSQIRKVGNSTSDESNGENLELQLGLVLRNMDESNARKSDEESEPKMDNKEVLLGTRLGTRHEFFFFEELPPYRNTTGPLLNEGEHSISPWNLASEPYSLLGHETLEEGEDDPDSWDYFFNVVLEEEVAVLEEEEEDDLSEWKPPAAISAIESLPSKVITEEEVAEEGYHASCAVCGEEIVARDLIKELPCKHNYHGDCIVPWLNITNTCPLCRYELPTDDPDYEGWKARMILRQRNV